MKQKAKKADENKAAFFAFPDFAVETELIRQGCKFIAGFDEAGRGALAGPLSVGCVVYDAEFILSPDKLIFSTVNDSKRLSQARRRQSLEYIKSHALFCGVKLIPHKTIDKININNATELAVNMLIDEMPFIPDVVIMDGNFKFNTSVKFISIKRGDQTSLSIASASIAAKVRRDYIMDRMALLFPEYGFAAHKGYGTKTHLQAIANFGPAQIHRKSYKPLKGMIADNENNK